MVSKNNNLQRLTSGGHARLRPTCEGSTATSKLGKILPIKGLRLADEIHADLKLFAASAGRTMTQQVRHYIVASVLSEREGVLVGEVADTIAALRKEHEEMKAQIQALQESVARLERALPPPPSDPDAE